MSDWSQSPSEDSDWSQSPSEDPSKHAATLEETEAWKQTFDLFDKNKDGSIEIDEVGTVVRALGLMPTEKQIKEQIKKVDKNNDGMMQFDDFKKFMMSIQECAVHDVKSHNKDILKAFQVFDKDGNNFITAEELKAVMTQLGERLTDEEAEQMIKVADVDADGRLDYEEFTKFMCGK